LTNVEHVDAERLQVGLDGSAQLVGLAGRGPAALLVTGPADLRHEV
jgi:hypothetical protein